MNTVIEHPASRIGSNVVTQLRRYTAEAEQLGHLHTEQLDVLYAHGWFKLFVPKVYGGLELSLPQGVRLEESVAWVDGSLGWVVTLCSGASWFSGFLEESVCRALLTNDRVCFAGSGAPTGVAEIVSGGYRVTGDWLYATGSEHATVFTANCVIHRDGVAVCDTEGNAEIRPFVFLRDEVTPRPAWKAIGMLATASNAFSVTSLFVPQDRCFRIDGRFATHRDAVFQYAFQPLAETTLAANYSGMALRFIDLCAEIFTERPRYSRSHTDQHTVMLQSKLESARLTLDNCRVAFFAVLDRSWEECIAGGLSAGMLADVTRTSRQLAQVAREVVDTLYPYAGLRAADPTTAINRVWRDLHTASQHFLLVF